jgi:hypothetical protein
MAGSYPGCSAAGRPRRRWRPGTRWHRRNSRPRRLDRALEFYDRWLPNTMRRIAGMTRACMTQCVMHRRPGDAVYVQRR